MNRLSVGSVLVLVLLAGCTEPSTQTGDSGSIAPPKPIDGDPPHFQNQIILTKNEGGVTGATAACVGTVTMYRLPKVQRKHKIRWYIHNDPYNPCPMLDINQVELHFANAVMAEGVTPSEAGLNVLTVKPGQTWIQARVHANPATAPNGVKKYVVFYKMLQAGPDPELDIDGDCVGCGPGS